MDRNDKIYEVVEIFKSINGESLRAGELALFIRFKGCNLKCSYCDTSWANDVNTESKLMSSRDIVSAIIASNVDLVTLTGGEPLLQKHPEVLLKHITDETDVRVEIETNGSVDITDFKKISSDNITFTLDYKLASSNYEYMMNMKNYGLLSKNDSVKFVAGNKSELERAYEIIKKYRLDKNTNVFLSPIFGRIEPEEIVEYMTDKNLNGVRLQLQMHKYIWDPDATGV